MASLTATQPVKMIGCHSSEGDPRAIGVVHRGALGFVRRAGGTEHVTYDSDLLYLVANERVALTANV